jgi:hypothetical protein
MRVKLLLSLLVLAFTLGQTSLAATLAVELGAGGLQNANYGGNVTLGWGFTLNSGVIVTDLGYFDAAGGLIDPHPVGIWNGVGNLIAQATVPAGNAGTLVSGFRFVAIPPVSLSPGAYSIGGYANGTSPDQFRFEVPSITTIAGLSFGPTDLFTRADSLSRPTTKADVFTLNGFFGPDFMVSTTTTQIPEPGGPGLALLGLAIVMARVFRRPNAERASRSFAYSSGATLRPEGNTEELR